MRNKVPKILVVGDIILDTYIEGTAERLSPEAPVPVVRVCDEYDRLGGAANVARNLVALGANVTLAGAIGNDPGGTTLQQLAIDAGIDAHWVVTDRPTTRKTRVMAGQYQVVRYDRESTDKLTPDVQRDIQQATAGAYDAVIVSDYAKGVVFEGLVSALAGKSFTVVDPKPAHWHLYAGAHVATPNRVEAREIARLMQLAEGDVRDSTVASELVAKMGLRDGMLLTLGAEGMRWQPADLRQNSPFDVPAEARSVFDVTGAGDSVAAAYTFCKVTGMDDVMAVRIANKVGGYVVGIAGTAVCERAQFDSFIVETRETSGDSTGRLGTFDTSGEGAH